MFPTHEIVLTPELVENVTQRRGKLHAYDSFDASKTALVVIDMQNVWVKEGQPAYTPYCRGIVANINRLAVAVREKGGRVIWVKMHHLPDTRTSWSAYMDFFGADHMAAMTAALTPGSEGAELWHEMDARPEDETVIKSRFSAMIQGSSDLEARLNTHHIDTVLITGTATNVCCESTARDAFMLNFKTIMISDANAARTDALQNATLNALFARFADVMTSDEVIARLEGSHAAAAE